MAEKKTAADTANEPKAADKKTTDAATTKDTAKPAGAVSGNHTTVTTDERTITTTDGHTVAAVDEHIDDSGKGRESNSRAAKIARGECVVPDSDPTPHVGRAVNGLICSAHAMRYNADGTPRG